MHTADRRAHAGGPSRLTALIGTLDPGGAERIMVQLTNAWVEAGWDVTLVLTQSAPGADPFFEPDARITLHRLGLAGASSGLVAAVWNNLRRLTAIRSAVRASRPDVVLAFLTDTNVLAIIATLGLHIPVIVEEHIYSAWPPLPIRWRMLRLLTYPLASSVVALTPSALRALGPAKGRRPRVIPNAVIPPPPGPLERPDNPVIVAMGRLVPQKGFDLLLEAAARLAPSHPDWRLEIWGEGPERHNLEARRDELGLADWVSLPGLTNDPYGVFRRCSLFVMSSRREGFPTVLGEAMACGLPVVSFDCPSGPRELIRDGVDGVLVPPGDVAGLAEGIERLLEDPAFAQELAARASDVMQRYALDQVLAQWQALFGEVLGARVGGRR